MSYFFLILFLFITPFSRGQNDAGLNKRVNLEDVSIQGEANKNRALLQNRNRFELDSRLQLRKEFRSEINEEIPPGFQNLDSNFINSSIPKKD